MVVTASQETQSFEKDKLIIRKDEKAAAAYVIKSGSVTVYDLGEDGNKVELATLGPGDLFGEMAILRKSYHHYNVMATMDTEVFVLAPEIINDKINQADPLLKAILDTLLHRLGRADEKIVRPEQD